MNNQIFYLTTYKQNFEFSKKNASNCKKAQALRLRIILRLRRLSVHLDNYGFKCTEKCRLDVEGVVLARRISGSRLILPLYVHDYTSLCNPRIIMKFKK